MNQINANQRLRVAATQKAEADKIMLVKAAEADAESKYLSGLGIARQRQAIIDGLRDSVQEFSSVVHGTTPTDVLNLLMVTQYFDMLKDVGLSPNANMVYLPQQSGAGGMGDLAGQIRNGMMQAEAAERQALVPGMVNMQMARAPTN
jgi:hypothetical protein